MHIGKNKSVKFGFDVAFAIVAVVLISSTIASQYFAWRVGYQPALGEPLFIARGHAIYQPFSWWSWNWRWGNSSGPVADIAYLSVLIAMGGFVLAVASAMLVAWLRSSKRETPQDLHGSARFAELADIERMGLISHTKKENGKTREYRAVGVIVGGLKTGQRLAFLRYNEAAHLLCYAPSRSGKGVGLVLPTLLTYEHSTMTNDVKGENYELTAGFRHSAGTLVMRFDPTAIETRSVDGVTRYSNAVYWNALDEIRIFTEWDVQDAQNLAVLIADPDAKGMEDHWVSTSFELLTGLFLHVKYAERDKSLTGASMYLSDPSFESVEQMMLMMINTHHDPEGRAGWTDTAGKPTKTHPVVAAAAQSMLNKEEKERNSVLSTAKTKLGLFVEPIVARNTSRSDFRIADLMKHTKAVSFYLVIPPSDKDRLRPLLRLFVAFMLKRLTMEMKFEDGASVKGYRHRLLGLLDEFPALRKLDVIEDGLGYLAGYGITLYLFAQDIIQIKASYGDKETITSGCQMRIAFAPNTYETAELLSNMSGKTTVKRQVVSYSGKRVSMALDQMSVSEEYQQRALLTPDEVMTLPRDEMLIFNAGHHVIRGHKIQYFTNPDLLSKAKIAPPSKVTMEWRGEYGTESNWFAVLCQRKADKTLEAIIHCYKPYPAVRVVVKQKNPDTEEVRSFAYSLCKMDGSASSGEIGHDDVEFILKPEDDVTELLIDEALEVHFTLLDPSPFKLCVQKGFFADISVAERDARRKLREHYGRVEQERAVQVAIDTIFEKAEKDCVYRGNVIIDLDKFVVTERNLGHAILHRKGHLDTVPQVGEQVEIRYSGLKGQVRAGV